MNKINPALVNELYADRLAQKVKDVQRFILSLQDPRLNFNYLDAM